MAWLRAPMQVPSHRQWLSCVSTQRSQTAQWCARSRWKAPQRSHHRPGIPRLLPPCACPAGVVPLSRAALAESSPSFGIGHVISKAFWAPCHTHCCPGHPGVPQDAQNLQMTL